MVQYSQLKSVAVSKLSEINVFREQRNNFILSIEDVTKDNDRLKEQINLLTESLEVVKVCINKLSEGHISHLQELVNSMLNTVFYDKKYSIDMQLNDTKNGKVLDLFLIDSTLSDEDPVVTELSSNGGGLQTVVGFVLQIYFIIYFKQERILFLDEALSAVSSEYIPTLVDFMRGLVDKYQFKFVAIFHDTRFSEYADTIYQVSNGTAKLVTQE
jgi:DNA repair exonuclease SbcCD ATPase subunit|nr:MAG TPA: chromosome partition protein [Caudoviricetes sp.]